MRLLTGFLPPSEGSTRTKRAFAWVPTWVGQHIIWLERYEVLQAFITLSYKVEIEGVDAVVLDPRWVTVSKRLINKTKWQKQK